MTAMHADLREPFFTIHPLEVEDAVIAALTAEVIWLGRSGELDALYARYPCFMTRTAAFERIMQGDRLEALSRRFEGRRVHLVAAAHDHALSLVLQVFDRKGRPTPAADALISIRLREGLLPDGRPLPEEDEGP